LVRNRVSNTPDDPNIIEYPYKWRFRIHVIGVRYSQKFRTHKLEGQFSQKALSTRKKRLAENVHCRHEAECEHGKFVSKGNIDQHTSSVLSHVFTFSTYLQPNKFIQK